MTYHSIIKLTWTPETSGRVSSAQIQSRVLGRTAWTEQAALADPKAGQFIFTSDAPGEQVEVRVRTRMTSGVFGSWSSITVSSPPIPWEDMYGDGLQELQDELEAVFAELTAIGSDSVLHRSEKPLVVQRHTEIDAKQTALVLRCAELGNPPTATNARDIAGNKLIALNSYLGSILPAWNNVAVNTPIDPNIWRTRWDEALQAIANFEAALIGGVSVDVQQALDQLDAITDDAVWSPHEKSTVLIPRDAELNGAWSLLDQRAATVTDTAVSNARTAASNARSAWATYRDARSPAWNNVSAPTSIDREQVRTLLTLYGNGLTALAQALLTYTNERATTALDRIAAMEADGVLSKGEKYRYVLEWQAMANRYDRLAARYIELGYPASVTAKQQAAYAALGHDPSSPAVGSLGHYLGGLSPAWTDSNYDTQIDPATLRTKWLAAENAADAFAAAMMAQPNADNTAAAINSGSANGAIDTRVNANGRVSQLNSNGQATSRRINSPYTVAGAQQVYIPINGNTNVGGTIQANVPGSPVWTYTDPNGGPTATIQVFDHKLIDDYGTTYYGGGYLFGASQGTQYWVYDDNGYAGGTTSYGFTTNAEYLNAPNRRLVGAVFTPTSAQVGPGGGVSGGGGGGSGIRERYYENQRTTGPIL